MRLRLRRALLAGAALCWAVQAFAQGGEPLEGRWLTPDGEGVIEIAPCGGGMCGRIVGMAETSGPDGQPSRSTDGEPQCGLVILRLPMRDDDGVWTGRILNPNDGSYWRCRVWRDAEGVHLRGYVLTPLLGRTQLWRPYGAPLPATCAMAG